MASSAILRPAGRSSTSATVDGRDRSRRAASAPRRRRSGPRQLAYGLPNNGSDETLSSSSPTTMTELGERTDEFRNVGADDRGRRWRRPCARRRARGRSRWPGAWRAAGQAGSARPARAVMADCSRQRYRGQEGAAAGAPIFTNLGSLGVVGFVIQTSMPIQSSRHRASDAIGAKRVRAGSTTDRTWSATRRSPRPSSSSSSD